ncbi:serine hydrolase domain-containing protein [Chryseosolibacter indicus]|uniref:Beta-lactamase family protein n=1 Tax=Chryseosolibacter indicus TaxID=2782351 RepID=A0ABS5VSD5_9BACT|nr:serine hydrolase domain-containing protein [Chryseosolibacter indicus]MBT1704327.1 beta-lactamase family protein [Chryseosolibacter indicus]
MKNIYVILALLCLVACNSAEKKNNTEDDSLLVTQKVKDRIDSTLKSHVDSGYVAGISALIFEKDKEVYFNAFGFADREAKKAMDRNTIVRIYSMTKPVTGTALMQLYEQGAFQLDDPLSKYLPEFTDMKVCTGVDKAGKLKLEPAKRGITIRDITRHTAGFASQQDSLLGKMVQEADVMNKENTLDAMTKKLAKLPLAFHPGEQWAYGISVDVQARLVEKLSGKPFDQYVRENILDPLKMTRTRYVPTNKDKEALAAMYRLVAKDTLQRIPDEEANAFNGKEWPLKPGGYGLTSSVDDYMRFAQMLVHEGSFDGTTILKPETVKLMATNHLADSITKRMWLPSKGQVGFGIDFAVRLREPASEKENKGAIGEFFWDGAASTLFWVDPVNELTAVLFVQVLPFDNTLHKKFRDAVYAK